MVLKEKNKPHKTIYYIVIFNLLQTKTASAKETERPTEFLSTDICTVDDSLNGFVLSTLFLFFHHHIEVSVLRFIIICSLRAAKRIVKIVCACAVRDENVRYARLSRYYYYYYLLKPFNNLLWSFVFFIFFEALIVEMRDGKRLIAWQKVQYIIHTHRH